jgi:putative ATP-binding cassette transporter
VLYSISRILTLGLLVYAAIGTAIAIIAGQRLIKINYNQLRLEGNFRYGMVHVRDNAESIAFYRGEGLERQQVTERLMSAIRNFDLLIIWQSIIDLFQYGYNYFTRIVPYVIVAPLYFAGETDFGTIGQAYLAFSQVLGALSLITNRIDTISLFAASISRLGSFYERLNDPAQLSMSDKQHRIQSQMDGRIAIRDLTLFTPNNEQKLVEDLSLEVEPDERLLIVGSSGCGKSSLMRAIAGLWTNGEGTIIRPDISETLFLPQRPYMLLGTLREQIIYPNTHANVSDDEIYEVLEKVNLANLPGRVGGLDVERDWPTVLSLGEQQRLAFARILLSQPRYAMLDEATSALDVKNERELYDLIRKMGVVYVSVGHRPSLLDYHEKVLVLGSDEAGWHLTSTQEYQFA